jgi:hypothetical protein
MQQNSDGLVGLENKEEAMTITSGCRCGAVRYSIEAEAITARHCWCRDCQYIAGSGTVNVFFPTEAVKVQGALSDYTNHAASGNLMHRQFCPTCGTPVFTQSDARRIGHIFKIGDQPINANLTAYYNVVTPDDAGANWQLRAQWTFLFPTH